MRLRPYPPALIQNLAPIYILQSPIYLSHCAILAAFLGWFAPLGAQVASLPQPGSLSPAALAATPDGTRLFIACATANEVAVFDVTSGTVTSHIAVPHTPSGLALSSDGARLYVTCAAPQSSIRVLDTGSDKVLASIPAGHSATAPVLSPDGKTLAFARDGKTLIMRILHKHGRTGRLRHGSDAVVQKRGFLLDIIQHRPIPEDDGGLPLDKTGLGIVH